MYTVIGDVYGMNLRNTSRKKNKFKIKYVLLLVIIYFVFCYAFYYNIKINKTISNEEFIKLLLKNDNYDILNSNFGVNFINDTVKYTLNIDFTKPSSIFNATVFKDNDKNKILSNNTINLEYNDDYSNFSQLKDISSYINDPSSEVVSNPVVYIYNSHQLENYSNENLEIYGITPNVLMASYLLKEKLNKLGIPTIVEDTNITELLRVNNWDYSSSYKASRLLILSKLNEYSSIKYLIDIHRDSVTKNMTTVSINNKNYARILFVVGQDHNNWNMNYDSASKLNTLIENNYKGLSRGILKKTGYGVDGVYNQDLSSNSILIEVGGVENNIDEVLNTVNALSDVIYKFIKEG